MIELRLSSKFTTIRCPIDDVEIPLVAVQPSTTLETVQAMDRKADERRDLETATSIVAGKLATEDFDVFISYNRDDISEIRGIVEQLKSRGILPWLDLERLRPGTPWQKAVSKDLKKIKSAAVFVGQKGIGPWQDAEQEAVLNQFIQRRKSAVIPVILPGSPKKPKLPLFLQNMTWVDFRMSDPDPLAQLIWGITGRPPHSAGT